MSVLFGFQSFSAGLCPGVDDSQSLSFDTLCTVEKCVVSIRCLTSRSRLQTRPQVLTVSALSQAVVHVYSGVEELRVGGLEPMATCFYFLLPLLLLSPFLLLFTTFITEETASRGKTNSGASGCRSNKMLG